MLQVPLQLATCKEPQSQGGKEGMTRILCETRTQTLSNVIRRGLAV